MKILLTGGSGMVGQNVLEIAVKNQHDFLSPSSSELDLLDANAIRQYLTIHQPEMIIHAAGIVGGIQANIKQPVKFYIENTQIGLNILTAATDCNIKKFLNFSSSSIYPNNAINPLVEELILKGELDPLTEGYALAKLSITRLCEYICREESSLLYKSVIPCNLYGRFDSFDPEFSHMIPSVIKRIHDAYINNLPEIEVWGDGSVRRELMYGEDLAEFVFYAIDNFEKMPQNLNVGLGTDYTMNDYYQAVANVIGYSGQFKHDLSKPVGMKQKLIDDTKLKKFGWHHKVSLEDGIKKTYKYYLQEIVNGK